MESSNFEEIKDYLLKTGVVTSVENVEELSGGIVNTIYRADTEKGSIIIKKYLKTPKFDPTFILPLGRYFVEKHAYEYLGNILHKRVTPNVIFGDDEKEILIVEDVGHQNRIDKNIHGVDPEVFSNVGRSLAEIANATYGHNELLPLFNNTEFQELKNLVRFHKFIENVDLFPVRDELMKRAHEHRVALMHDDIRFNNMFVSGSSFYFIDFEGAFYGDVVLDISHTLSELFIYYHSLDKKRFEKMIRNTWESFTRHLHTPEDQEQLEWYVVKHIGFGLLDRVQGVIKDDYPFVKDRERIKHIAKNIIVNTSCSKINDLLV